MFTKKAPQAEVIKPVSQAPKPPVSARMPFMSKNLAEPFPRRNSLFDRHFVRLDEIDAEVKQRALVAETNIARLTRELAQFSPGTSQHKEITKEIDTLERTQGPYALLVDRRVLEKKAFNDFLETNYEAQLLVAEFEAFALKEMNSEMRSLGYELPSEINYKTGIELAATGAGYGGTLGALVYRRKLGGDKFESVSKVIDRTTGHVVAEEIIVYDMKTGEVQPHAKDEGAQQCFKCHVRNIKTDKVNNSDMKIVRRLAREPQ